MAYIHPASNSLGEKGSLRNKAPEKPVKVGVRNVNTVASDNDRYFKEKYMPQRPVNLRQHGEFVRRRACYRRNSHPQNPRNTSKVRTPLGPRNGSGIFFQYLIEIENCLCKQWRKDAHERD